MEGSISITNRWYYPAVTGYPNPTKDSFSQCDIVERYYRRQGIRSQASSGLFGIKKDSWDIPGKTIAHRVTCSSYPIFGLTMLNVSERTVDFSTKAEKKEKHVIKAITDIDEDGGVLTYQIPFSKQKYKVVLPRPQNNTSNPS